METVLQVLNALIMLLIFTIFFRVLLSWFNVRPGSTWWPLVTILDQITEPILSPMRRIIPRMGMIDITPMATIFLLYMLRVFINVLLA